MIGDEEDAAFRQARQARGLHAEVLMIEKRQSPGDGLQRVWIEAEVVRRPVAELLLQAVNAVHQLVRHAALERAEGCGRQRGEGGRHAAHSTT